MEQTSENDAWIDSFDKLINCTPKQRGPEIIKDSVRVSFNIDSSVENSIKAIEMEHGEQEKVSDSISTPCSKRLVSDLFHCGLSPITGIKLDGFGCNTNKPKCNEMESKDKNEIRHKYVPKNGGQGDNEINSNCQNNIMVRPPVALQPGKWRKSLNTWRKTHECGSTINKCITPRGITEGRPSSRSLVTTRMSVRLTDLNKIECNHEREILNCCDQVKPLPFHTTYTLTRMTNPAKVGEGAYGEVFKCTTNNYGEDNVDIVLKIIPIEGSIEVNGEKQKSFAEILPEIIITKKMSSLKVNANNSTVGFVNIHKATLVRGKYPQHLIKLWEQYDSEKNSENDHPRVFGDNQLFIVLELEFAGHDMSNFIFKNAEQSYFMLKQIILTLAIGEEECQFEHRDLHWGNVLIKNTDKADIYFKFMNNDLTLPSKGVKISIIDYTLSRITIGQSCYFNDLSSDEDLFSATGDYQYDIYRMMRTELKNNWSSYSPKTNILWLSYLVSKLIKGVRYKYVNTNIHRQHIENLKKLQNNILSFDSAASCAKNMFKLT